MNNRILANLAILAAIGIISGLAFSDDPPAGNQAAKPDGTAATGPASRQAGGPRSFRIQGGPASGPAGANMEMIDNPQFESWSKCKIGTSITVETTGSFMRFGNFGNAPDKDSKTEMTYTLKEKADDKIVLDVKTSAKMPGKDEPEERTYPMTISPKTPKMFLPQFRPNTKELGKGEEEIKFGDKSFKCEWKETESTMEMRDKKIVTKTKTWSCKDMPGGTVKMEMTTAGEGEKPEKPTYSMEVVEVKLAE